MFIHETLVSPDKKQFGKLLVVAAGLYSVFFCVLTFQQTRVWKNDGTLWSNVIKNYPGDNRIQLCYQNRAAYYFDQGKYDDSLKDFLTVIRFNPQNSDALQGLATIYGMKGELASALDYVERAIELVPDDPRLYLYASEILRDMGNHTQEELYKNKANELGRLLNSR
jgi:tetratricopeptide (TPR) repeat protein